MNSPLHEQPAHPFIHQLAQRLIELAQPPPGATVLAVGTGSGTVTLCAAAKVGPTGKIIGLKRTAERLATAQRNDVVAGCTPIELRVSHPDQLSFAAETFDLVLCPSAVFLLTDLPTGLREWWRVLKQGGRVAFSGYGGQAWQPLLQRFVTALPRYGLTPPRQLDAFGKPHWFELEQYSDLLRNAGFSVIDVRGEQLGRYLADSTEWWRILGDSGLTDPLAELAPQALAHFKADHLAEVAKLASAQGIWLNVAAIFAVARKGTVDYLSRS